MLRILVFLPFLVVGNALDFLNVNLQKKVNLSTDQRTFAVNVSISWLNKPPYIYNEKDPKTEFQFEAKDSRKDDQNKGNIKNAKVKGIFYEVVNKGLQICGVIHSEGTKYSTNAAEDLQQLDQTIVQKKADIAMPVHGSEEGKYGGYEYVEVLKSPGVVFIVNRQETQQHSRNRVLRAMKDTWPVIVITLLMTGLAGLFIWGLDTSGNPDHFPRSFTRGVMEGVWWSFVSMTTVGYGDRIPKSYLARLFGILWILTGLVLCSFFTATFTSALTSSSIKQRESLLGAKVAVIADSHAYDEALKHAVNVKDYPNFYQMYDALMEKKEVDGILADIYTASYYMYNIGDSRLAVTMFFRSQRSIGFVTRPEHFFLNVNLECLRNLFKYRQRDIKKIILQNTQVFHNETRNRRLTDDDTDIIVTLLDGDSHRFKSTSLVLFVVFFLILTVGFACESCLATFRKRRVTRPPVKACLPDSINLTEKLPSCKPNHCRKTSLK